jgi:hypothetical protein
VSGGPSLHANIIEYLFPSRLELDGMLNDLDSDPIHASLAVLDPLIPPASAFQGKNDSIPVCDKQGYSSYARVVSALLRVSIEDRQSAKENMWALRHIQALAMYAGDFLQIPSRHSPVFGQQVLKVELQEIISKAQQVTTYLLTSSADERWRLQVIATISNGRTSVALEGLAEFLTELIIHATAVDAIRESRILHTILTHVLDNADKDESEQWILFARKFEKTGSPSFLSYDSYRSHHISRQLFKRPWLLFRP